MRDKKKVKLTLLLILPIILLFNENTNISSMDKVSEITTENATVALLEKRISLLSAEKEALLEENRQLQNDLARIISFYKELRGDIKWYIDLAESPFTPEEAARMVGHLTDGIIKAIMGFDPEALARYIHPRKGVRFSASAMVSRSDPVFTREQVHSFVSDPQEYIWGIYGGSGERIIFSPKDFFMKILCSRRFEDGIVRFNKVYEDFGGNHYLVYPNSVVVEYLYEGTEEWGFVDTAVLRIVFQQHDDRNWYVVGIIYDDRS